MKLKILKAGLLVICLVLLVYAGIRVALFMQSPFQQLETGNEIDKITVENGNIRINMLVMGLDNDEIRTDTILLASYSTQDGVCSVLSIPRDTYVNINGRSTLVNAAYYEGGAELTIQKVKELTGLPIHYYVVFTFRDFRNIIDGLGGVEFEVRPKGYYYADPYQNLYINIPGGTQVLDGKQAEGLVRYRADYARADLERVEIQQKFVHAVIEQKLNKKYLRCIPGIYADIKDSVKSNLSLDVITDYANEIVDAGVNGFESFTLPTIEYGAHLVPDKTAIDLMINEYFSDAETE